MGIPIIKYSGNEKEAIRRTPFGIALLRIVRNFMSFQNLRVHQDRRVFADGCVITVTSTFGIDIVNIFFPIISQIRVKEKLLEPNKYMLQHVVVECGLFAIVWCVDLNAFTVIPGISNSDWPVSVSNPYLVAWKLENPALDIEDPWDVEELTEANDTTGLAFTIPPCSAAVVTTDVVDPIPACGVDPDYTYYVNTAFNCTFATTCNIGGNHHKYWIEDRHYWNCDFAPYHENEGWQDNSGGEYRPAVQQAGSILKLARAFNLANNFTGNDGYYCTQIDYNYSGSIIGMDPSGGTPSGVSESLSYGQKTHMGTIYTRSAQNKAPADVYVYDAKHYFAQGIVLPEDVHNKKCAAVQIFGLRIEDINVRYAGACCELVSYDGYRPDNASINNSFSAAVKLLLDENVLTTYNLTGTIRKTYNNIYQGQKLVGDSNSNSVSASI